MLRCNMCASVTIGQELCPLAQRFRENNCKKLLTCFRESEMMILR